MTRAGDLIGLDGVRVLDEQCDTCVFLAGNLMHLAPGALRKICAANLANGGWITCHKTLPEVAGHGRAAVCRGWVDAHGLGPTVTTVIGWFGRDDVAP